MKNTVVIGLCGSSGSGKGYVSSVFSSFGALHIDTDAVYHSLLEPSGGKMSPCVKAIKRKFGDSVVDGAKLDRAALGDVVFSDAERRSELNAIAHAYIKKETLKIIRSTCAPFAVVDAPLLFESGFDRLCDFTVCVTADDETKIERIERRDGISRDKAQRRLAAQKSDAELLSLCDYSIDNSRGRDVTEDVAKILDEAGLLAK
ncbi:MAG: dephospho-CoA kinase [Clostridia bacterium]|nr:dephospho-CoA kinase [Clostridia bacterium]